MTQWNFVMGMYTRYKKSPEGLRQIVTLLEMTPKDRRERMLEVGMSEDPQYTRIVTELMITFDDIAQLPDLELAEVVATAPPRVSGMAIAQASSEIKERFMRNAKPKIAAEMRETFEGQVQLAMIGGARLKLIEITRQLESQGLLKVKVIPAT